MKKSHRKANPTIIFGFVLLIMIIIVIGGFAVYESRQITNFAEKIYLHPLTVSNAIKDIKANINAMHRSMKDVVLATTPAQLDESVDKVAAYEEETFKLFDTIEDRFLGDKEYVLSARRDFENWKPIRSKVIMLMREGRQEEAAEITKEEGVQHIVLMNEGRDRKSGLNYLLDFANNKASEFQSLAKQRRKWAVLEMFFILFISLTLAFIVVIVLLRSIKMTHALEESEERFRAIFDQAAVGVTQIETKTGRFLKVNQKYCDMVGYTEEELTRSTFMAITYPDDLQADLDNIQKLIGGKINQFSMEKRYKCKDGSIIWVNLTVSPMWDIGEEANFHITVVEDISDKKKAEEALQRAHEGLELKVKERTAELVTSNELLRREIEDRKNAEGKVRLNEARLEALLKMNEMRKATIKELSDFVLEEGVKLTQSKIGFIGFMNDEETVMTLHAWSQSVMGQCGIIDKPIHYPIKEAGLWGDAIRQHKSLVVNDYSVPNPQKKGYPAKHIQLLRIMVVPVVIHEKKVVALIAVGNKEKNYDELDLRQLKLLIDGMWEIIEHNKAEEDSRQLREKLSHLTRVATIGELTTSLAHELNQPLTTIMSNAQAIQRLLKRNVPDMSEVKDALTDIINDNRRASEVIRSLRKLLKQGDMSKTSLDINNVIEETTTLVRSDIIANNISLKLDLTTQLPIILGNHIQLQHVILNLILNGVEAMKDATPDSRELVITTHNDDHSTVTVVIQDSGNGIDSEKFEKVFDPFFTTKSDGLGMGLSINKTIIEAHGGRIWATQNPDGGAIISFNLPVYKEQLS